MADVLGNLRHVSLPEDVQWRERFCGSTSGLEARALAPRPPLATALSVSGLRVIPDTGGGASLRQCGYGQKWSRGVPSPHSERRHRCGASEAVNRPAFLGEGLAALSFSGIILSMLLRRTWS
jgi:hypothetical protein